MMITNEWIDKWIDTEFKQYDKDWFDKRSDKKLICYINGNLFKTCEGVVCFKNKTDLYKALKQSTPFVVIKCKFYHLFSENKELNSTRLTHKIFNRLIERNIIVIKQL